MAGIRWSGKKVRELLEELSDGQKAFKTKPSGTPVKDAWGYKQHPNGYFQIEGAYGGYKLAYVLPYSSAETNVTEGYIPSGRLADKLLTMGRVGLKAKYLDLQKRHKKRGKEMLEYEKARRG